MSIHQRRAQAKENAEHANRSGLIVQAVCPHCSCLACWSIPVRRDLFAIVLAVEVMLHPFVVGIRHSMVLVGWKACTNQSMVAWVQVLAVLQASVDRRSAGKHEGEGGVPVHGVT